MFKCLISAGLAFGLVAAAPPASAANCGQRTLVIEKLSSKYAEKLTVGGLQTSRSSQTVMEVWSSPETGTFTVLVTNPNGISCVVAAGTDFFEAAPELTVDGAPT